MFVIAMAGESRRFREAGYGDKYRLPLNGVPLFDHAVGSFSHYFASAEFLFV
jgi:molybdopterin-guanine dinucleotide biosynthesis protein A